MSTKIDFNDVRKGDRVRLTRRHTEQVTSHEVVVRSLNPGQSIVATSGAVFYMASGPWEVELLERPEPVFDPISLPFPEKGKIRVVALHDDGSGVAFDLSGADRFVRDVYTARHHRGVQVAEWERGIRLVYSA